MFGYVSANWKELTKEQQQRYQGVYCGICRCIRSRFGNTARLGLSYDMAFLALVLMSLYEPEETGGKRSCMMHPAKPRPWVDNQFVRYAADMNVALAYYNFLDDWQDDGKHTAKWLAGTLSKAMPELQQRYPRQCRAMEESLEKLSQLERTGCSNPDETAGAFGELMAQLFVYEEDLWTPTLSQMGDALGRFIYLLDGAMDYDKDKRKGKYNPYLAMGMEKDPARWEEYLVLTMGRATTAFEKLPLVQDKGLLDNILYSGIWVSYRAHRSSEVKKHDRGPV